MEDNSIVTEAAGEIAETATEKAAEAEPGKKLGFAAGVGLGVLAGALLCRFVAGPAIAKLKARKAAEAETEEFPEEECAVEDDREDMDETE